MNIMKCKTLNEKRRTIDGTYNVDGFYHRGRAITRTEILSHFGTTNITNMDLLQYLDVLKRGLV